MCDIVDNLISYISSNIKDFVNICFWIFTGIIAYLTYKNAKKTLFNPIRSEMVKYQMKTLSDFIDKNTSKGYSMDTLIDYSNLLKLNYEVDYLFHILKNEGNDGNHTFDELDSSRLRFCEENLGGLFEIRIKNEEVDLEPVYGDFDTTKQYIQTTHIKEKEAIFSQLNLQRIYLTKRFINFYDDLRNLQTNPFVPNEIKSNVTALISNIYANIGELHKLLDFHISRQTDTNYREIYSQFAKTKIDHKRDLENFRNSITTYFRVNKS